MQDPPVEELYVLTLAIEEALTRDDWASITSLLEARQDVIKRLPRSKPSKESIRKLLERDKECLDLVTKQWQELSSTLQHNYKKKKAANAYKQNSKPNAHLMQSNG